MTCKDCTWFYRGDCTASVATIDEPNLTDIKHVGEDGKTCRKFEQRMTAKKNHHAETAITEAPGVMRNAQCTKIGKKKRQSRRKQKGRKPLTNTDTTATSS